MRRPLVYFFIAFLAALCLSHYINGSFSVYLLAATMAIIVVAFIKIKHKSLLFALFIPIFTLSFAYFEWREDVSPAFTWEQDTAYEIEGHVAGFPQKKGKTYTFPLHISTINGDKENLKITVICPSENQVAFGDILYCLGTALLPEKEANPGFFDYKKYQENSGIAATLYVSELVNSGEKDLNPLEKAGFWLRQRLLESLAFLSIEQQSFIAGIFLGDTGGIDQRTFDLLSKSGILHCFSVSGLHVGYIVLFLHMLLSLLRLSRQSTLVIIAPALLLYCAITGFYPTVCRAAIMCFLVYWAMARGRPGDGFSALALAAFILLLWRPGNLWLASFQLSFAAMFSILYFMPYLQGLVPGKFPGKDVILITLAAQILLLPLVAYHFQVVSIVSFFVNSLACLLSGAIVILSLGALILAALNTALGSAPLVLAGMISEAIIVGITAVTKLPFAYYYCAAFPLWLLFLGYSLFLLLPRLSWLKFRPLMAGFCLFIVMISVLFPYQLLRHPDKLEITFLTVGEGDSAFITTPQGKNIFIDIAGDPKDDTAIYRLRPFLLAKGINTVDYIFLSHHDQDHAGSFSYLVDFFRVKNVVFTKAAYYYSQNDEALALSKGIDIIKVETGDTLTIDGITFEVLHPNQEEVGESNYLSMVVKVAYNDFSALFTGDITNASINRLFEEESNLEADIVKVPHHGSKDSFSKSFYEAVNPQVAIISTGENNYGHPGSELLNHFITTNIPYYRTDLHGAISITTTGEGFYLETYGSKQEHHFP